MTENKNDWEDSSEEDVEMEHTDNVQVKFVTKLESKELEAPSSAYYVPIALTRYGLSEVLNSLLQLGE